MSERKSISLAQFFDRRANALNLVRLVLAASVLFWHAYPLTGRAPSFHHGSQLLEDGAVDGFFAITGFLLVGSWISRPDWRVYAKNRFLRIMPGYWACLLVVAFGFAPITAALRDQSVPALFSGPHSAFRHVIENSLLQVRFFDVDGGPTRLPFPGVWNGSLWTLRWEAGFYVLLALTGLFGLLRRRNLLLGAFGVMWVLTLLELHSPVNGEFSGPLLRLGFMFGAGMVLALFADRIPAQPIWALLAAVALICSQLLSDYRVVGGPALAYLVIWLGGAIRHPSLSLNDRDISYGLYIYGFPVQQGLAMTAIGTWPALPFGIAALAATVPLAAVSWILVERPMLRRKTTVRVTSAPAPAQAV